jgi:peptidoglycan pentaglycine glycine transferase (the first glycine)
MKLTFRKYTENDRDIWEEFNLSSTSTFLTSIYWIEFQKLLGKEIQMYLIISENNSIKGLIYIEISRRKIANFGYTPYGPVLSSEIDLIKTYEEIKIFMKKFIEEKKLTLFRFDPLLSKNHLQNLHQIGFKTSLAPAQARDVWEIDITLSEMELRSAMSKSTRYNINKTLKSGIEIIQAETLEDVKAFSDLMNETTNRKSFGNFDYEYFKKQFETLNPKGVTRIFLAKYQGKFLAGALINFYKETSYYTHGCSTSDSELQKLRAPYLLQWEIIKFAKAEGYKKYNMWGILPEQNLQLKTQNLKHSSMVGVSDFKKSFGGYEVNYVGPLEVYINPIKYNIHRLLDYFIYKKDRY